jgi:hypothetical protein
MNNLEADKGTTQLVASEASAGAKGGWGDCDDLAIRRDDVDANAHHAGTRTRKEGTGDLSSSDPEAPLKLKKSREKQACYRQNMPEEKRDRERQRLDSIQMNETPEKIKVQLEKERKWSATHLNNQSDKARAENGKYMRGYMSKKRAKVKATLPPSPDKEEEVDAMADPPPSSPEQRDAETTAVDALMALTETKRVASNLRKWILQKWQESWSQRLKTGRRIPNLWRIMRRIVLCKLNAIIIARAGRDVRTNAYKKVRWKMWGRDNKEKRALVFLQVRISKKVSTWSSTSRKLFPTIPTTSIQRCIKSLIFGLMQVSQIHLQSLLITVATQTV